MFKPFMRHRKSGVTRIVRDNYGDKISDWRALAKEVKQRDGNKCVQCSSTEELDVHHIVPLSKGGRTVKSNLITLCKYHHEGKHSHMAVRRGSK